ncbi:hypothetical protein [Eilatimonas milleporae]|uniref:Uncharacterized protein n=1 Tax=Eilatimonas milleporae TaxID=911205 RepID=A0A3M0CSK0_9PROT|nr:hypothetical protein [Eilatimonas milleporae]RMB11907.1 hypothetical protein BXY39_0394 [Eilatimonas milleporae]
MNTGILYDINTGKILQNMRLAKCLDIEADFTPPEGTAVLPGVLADDVDCWRVENGTLVETSPSPINLDIEKRAACYRVDRIAGAQRSYIISDGYGQEMTYLMKEAEARACLADPAPLAGAYPMLAAEIGITGADLTAVATAVAARADVCKTRIAAIEATRLTTKAVINAATDLTAIEAAIDAADWPPREI